MPLDFKPQLEKQDLILRDEHKIFCASCHSWITSSDWKLNIKGGHEHTVFNPAGHLFNIVCFRDAPGCQTSGKPSSDFTWFKNYKWRLSFCKKCSQHLGWCFTGSQTPPLFFGLIQNRLVWTRP